jgi:hypothetical protein
MGLRFYRRVHLFPGVSMNVSRSGPSLTFGIRGAHVTVGSTGVRKTVGLPGTGIFYTSRHGYHTGYHSAKSDVPVSEQTRTAADRKAERTIAAVVLGIVIFAILALLW